MQAVAPHRFQYRCRFVSLHRRSPQPSRAALLFQECLGAAHAGGAPGQPAAGTREKDGNAAPRANGAPAARRAARKTGTA